MALLLSHHNISAKGMVWSSIFCTLSERFEVYFGMDSPFKPLSLKCICKNVSVLFYRFHGVLEANLVQEGLGSKQDYTGGAAEE